jgi:hypothetical protein
MPAPSPSTKPSRSLSHGREALAGSSLRVDMAFIEQKPPIAVGDEPTSAPPATITSASPYWIMRMATPMLWFEVARGHRRETRPLRPSMIDSWPGSMLMMVLGT